MQLSPWHTASVQAQEVVDELARLIPPEKRDRGMVWYVESVPDTYKGAYVLRIGLGAARAFTDGDFADVRPVAHAPDVDVTGDRRSRDTFALRFAFDKSSDSYHVAYASGMTARSPLTLPNSYATPLVWNFRQCERQVVQAWRVIEANASCERGEGLLLSATTEDLRIVSTGLRIRPVKSNARFVRIRTSVVYRQGEDKPAATGQWFWNEPEGDWREERSRKSSVLLDGNPRVYWTFLHASEVGDVISGLRFDPANERVSCTVQWISVDLVK